MNNLVIKNKDRHTIRLIDGFKSCGINLIVTSKREEIETGFYDMIFLDPSVEFELPKIYYNKLFFFDTEDDPKHFDKGPAYDLYKDKVKAYVKMNFIENDRNDGIKNIGFPLSIYPILSNVAKFEVPEQYNNFTPVLISSPTFIGQYEVVESGIYNSDEDITCLGKFDNHFMYNQRYDWLLSLRKHNILYIGGIVFHENTNLSYAWQSRYFGLGISKLQINSMCYQDTINKLFNNRIALCPTGHERISWRTYDIMATGSILIRTDNKKQLALINPKEYITIYDGQDLGPELIKLQPQYKELLKLHQTNREIFKTLTPTHTLNLFLKQLD